MKPALGATLTLVAALGAPAPAHAHALDLTTAQVAVRDRHAEIVVEVDLVRLVATVDPAAGDATALAAADDARLARHLAAARGVLEAGAHLDADGAEIPLTLRRMPTTADLRRAAHDATTPDGHPSATLRFEATRSLPEARQVTVALPPALGRVLYTYSQPTTRLGQAGAGASFAVLAPRAEVTPTTRVEPRAAPEPASDRGWLAVVAGVLAVVALLTHVVPRARRALA